MNILSVPNPSSFIMFLLLTTLLSTSTPSALGAEEEDEGRTCLSQEYDRLVQTPSVHTALADLLNAFNGTCHGSGGDDEPAPRCSTDIDPVTLHIVQDFNRIPSRTRTSLKNMCESRGFGGNRIRRTMCDVTVTTVVTASYQNSDNGSDNDNNGINMILDSMILSTRIVELDKPVCFPSTCEATPEYARLLEPPSVSCQAANNKGDGSTCEVLGYEVTCPKPHQTSSPTPQKCASNALSPVSPFWLQRKAAETAMFLDCATAMSSVAAEDSGSSDGANNIKDPSCAVEIGNLSGGMTMNFTGIENDDESSSPNNNNNMAFLFETYEKACFEENGRVCRVDLEGQLRIDPNEQDETAEVAGGTMTEEEIVEELPTNLAMGTMLVHNALLDYPQCVPRGGCPTNAVEDDEVTDLLRQSYIDFMANRGVSCDVDSPDCNVTVTNVSCYDQATATVAPIITTKAPTQTTTAPTMMIMTTAPTMTPTTTSSSEEDSTDNGDSDSSNILDVISEIEDEINAQLDIGVNFDISVPTEISP